MYMINVYIYIYIHTTFGYNQAERFWKNRVLAATPVFRCFQWIGSKIILYYTLPKNCDPSHRQKTVQLWLVARFCSGPHPDTELGILWWPCRWRAVRHGWRHRYNTHYGGIIWKWGGGWYPPRSWFNDPKNWNSRFLLVFSNVLPHWLQVPGPIKATFELLHPSTVWGELGEPLPPGPGFFWPWNLGDEG